MPMTGRRLRRSFRTSARATSMRLLSPLPRLRALCRLLLLHLSRLCQLPPWLLQLRCPFLRHRLPLWPLRRSPHQPPLRQPHRA